jgi:hypothetical protein
MAFVSGCRQEAGAQAGEGQGAPQMPPPPAVSAAQVIEREVTQWD